MKIKVKKINPNAAVPKKAKPGDFCYDVVATSRRRIGWKKWEYGIGLAFEIERPNIFEDNSELDTFLANYDLVNLSIDFRPRSSVHKTGLVLSNCCGTIDELYRGEVKAIFYKVAPGKIYKVGDRIGQIKLGLTLPLEFEVVEELSETERGSGGFGSTGR